MMPAWPGVEGQPSTRALVRSVPEDFVVVEELGFRPSGEGEHVFLLLQKRQLNTQDLVRRVSVLSGIPRRDIGISGLKDRNAVTRQWLSVRMAGRTEPQWQELEQPGDVNVLECVRHTRKLKRGVHRGNAFTLRLRQLEGGRSDLEKRLQRVAQQGVPNYFGEQRFGREGSTLQQAESWMNGGGGRLPRERRGLYLSALRSYLFNELLAERVRSATWNQILDGDVCCLAGSRSVFNCERADAEIEERAHSGDIHPGLPLWGRGESQAALERAAKVLDGEQRSTAMCRFLEAAAMELAWRPARLIPDDFCWQFCDDDSLQLEFRLGAGSYATALLAELVQYKNDQGVKRR